MTSGVDAADEIFERHALRRAGERRQHVVHAVDRATSDPVPDRLTDAASAHTIARTDSPVRRGESYPDPVPLERCPATQRTVSGHRGLDGRVEFSDGIVTDPKPSDTAGGHLVSQLRGRDALSSEVARADDACHAVIVMLVCALDRRVSSIGAVRVRRARVGERRTLRAATGDTMGQLRRWVCMGD
ncbi:hypothetical protein GCM10027515_17620 [Schumannella luteola]